MYGYQTVEEANRLTFSLEYCCYLVINGNSVDIANNGGGRDMSSKSLAGWMLAIGPIGMFLVWGILEPAVVGSGDTPQETLELALANEVAWNIFGIIGSLCFTSLFVGLSLLSLSMRGEGKAGDAWAAASVFVFAGLVGVGIASTGLSLQAVAIANEHGVAAGVPLQNVGDALSRGFGLFFDIAAIMLGTTIALQKTAPVFLGWLFALVGVFLFLGTLIDWDDTVIGIVVWLVMTLTVASIGIVTLRSTEASQAIE